MSIRKKRPRGPVQLAKLIGDIATGRTLRCTPAMEAGVTDRLWSIEDMARVVEEWEGAQKAAQ